MNKNCGRAGAGVRQYNKSQLPRLRWTPQLHHHFVQAVDDLGGKYKATPKRILQMMTVKGLSISHIKSHLQMYRSLKDSNNGDMVVPVRHRHLRLRRSASLNAERFSNLSLSKRIVENEHKDRERQGGNFKQQNFLEESDHSILPMEEAANLFERQQVKYACFLGKSSKDEDNGRLGEVCELSLSVNPCPATIQKSEDEKGYFCPLIGGLSHPTFMRTSKFSNNYINLDLTISTTFPS